mmetsp:Transcript_7970/g.22567  ORF Transcript_7970/g.22567 Transcript_7970/m.22567 type:complete len:207 (-) Transcript_7970:328-948(-)
MTSVTAVRVGSLFEGSSRTPRRSPWTPVLSNTTSTVWMVTPASGAAPPSGAGPACQRRSVSRVRSLVRSRLRILEEPTSGSQATRRSPGSTAHFESDAPWLFQRSTAPPGAMLSILSAPGPLAPAVWYSRSSMPQPSFGRRSTSASQTPGAECAAFLEKRSSSLSTPGFESTSIMRPGTVASLTLTSLSPARTSGFRAPESDTARL